jgi:hypothetical protein
MEPARRFVFLGKANALLQQKSKTLALEIADDAGVIPITSMKGSQGLRISVQMHREGDLADRPYSASNSTPSPCSSHHPHMVLGDLPAISAAWVRLRHSLSVGSRMLKHA